MFVCVSWNHPQFHVKKVSAAFSQDVVAFHLTVGLGLLALLLSIREKSSSIIDEFTVAEVTFHQFDFSVTLSVAVPPPESIPVIVLLYQYDDAVDTQLIRSVIAAALAAPFGSVFIRTFHLKSVAKSRPVTAKLVVFVPLV